MHSRPLVILLSQLLLSFPGSFHALPTPPTITTTAAQTSSSSLSLRIDLQLSKERSTRSIHLLLRRSSSDFPSFSFHGYDDRFWSHIYNFEPRGDDPSNPFFDQGSPEDCPQALRRKAAVINERTEYCWAWWVSTQRYLTYHLFFISPHNLLHAGDKINGYAQPDRAMVTIVILMKNKAVLVVLTKKIKAIFITRATITINGSC